MGVDSKVLVYLSLGNEHICWRPYLVSMLSHWPYLGVDAKPLLYESLISETLHKILYTEENYGFGTSHRMEVGVLSTYCR